jgi:alpha-maltose-1-phosphate synthase
MVFLSHPTGNANSRQALLAFYERKMLEGFYTTVAWNSNSKWNKVLPAGLSRELNRRTYPEIPRRMIHTASVRELCRVLFGRLGMSALAKRPGSPFSISEIYRQIDRLTAQAVAALTPKAVYAYDGGALQTFRIARKMGVKTIYELPTASWQSKRELFREEAELQPAFSESLHIDHSEPADWLRRKDQELELADQVIVPSAYVQSTLPASMSAHRILVLPYGAPLVSSGDSLPRSRTKEKLRVLYVGAITQRKGLSYLLEAMKKVEATAELTMIGSRVGPCQPLDAALQRCHWIPSVPHNVVLEMMRQHDVLAFPTLSEGFALVILEAMSQGLPVITTPNSGAEGIVTDGEDGFIVPIRSPEAIAERLELLALDRDRLALMREAARKKAAFHSWVRYREQLARVVQQVVAEPLTGLIMVDSNAQSTGNGPC